MRFSLPTLNTFSMISRTAVSDPSRDKWRTEHGQEIASILPQIEPMMRALGYPAGE